MAKSFAGFFAQSPELAQMPEATKMAIIDRAYESVQNSGTATSQQLREFRDAQMQTLYDLDQASGQSPQGESYQEWQDLHRGTASFDDVVTGLSGSVTSIKRREISPERQALFDRIDKRAFKETLNDIGRVAGDFAHYPKAIAKTASDLFGLAKVGADAAHAVFSNAATGNFAGAITDMQKALHQDIGSEKVNQWYEESIKDDPSMYKMYDSALVDATVGTLFGIARAKKAVNLINAANNAGVTAAASKGTTAARNFFAPVVSNVLGGQVVYHGLEALDEGLKDSELSDSTKTGLRVGALLLGTVASGLTLENFIEQAVAGNPLKIKAAESVGKAIEEAVAQGKPFQQVVAENQVISEDMKTLLGVRTPDDPAASNFDPTAAAAQVDLINSAQTKVRAGEELSVEEAEALHKVGQPTIGSEAFSPEELDEIVKPVTARAEEQMVENIPTHTVKPEGEAVTFSAEQIPARATDDFPPVDSFLSKPAQVKAAKPVAKIESVSEQVTKEATPFEKLDTFSERVGQPNVGQIVTYGSMEPTARPMPQTIDAGIVESGKQHILPYSRATFTQRGLATLDQLNKQAIELRAQSRAAQAAGDIDSVTVIEQQINQVVAQLKDTETAMAFTLSDTKALKESIASEAKAVEKQMADMRQKAKTASEEEKAAMRAEYSQFMERHKALQKSWETINTSQVILQRSGKELEVTPKTPEPPKDLIAKICKRQKSQTDADSMAAKATAVRARKGELYKFSPKPGGQDLQGIDPMTRLAELPSQAQLRVRQMTQALSHGYEAMLGRSLTEEENLGLMNRVLDDTNTTSGRLFEDTDKPLATATSSEGVVRIGVNAGYVETKYPRAFQILRVLDPGVVKSSIFSPDSILASMQGLVSRSGLGMDQSAYELSREVMREVFELWDDIKINIPIAEGDNLKTFLKENSAQMGLSKKQADAVAKSISDAFPDLSVAFRYDRAAAGISGMCDALTRLITIGTDAEGLRALSHELGHYHFYYGMDGEAKLTWLDSMRRSTDSDASWAAAFPGYDSRFARLSSMAPADVSKELFWMHNPAEMYAEQFSAYTLSNVIPQVDTLTSFAKVQNSLKQVLRVSNDAFDKMPEESKQFILKTLVAPDVTEMRKLDDAKIQKLLEDNWYYVDRDTAMQTVENLTAELDATYSGRMVGLEGQPTEVLDQLARQAAEGVTDVYMPSFASLPAEQRVAMYSFEDLPKVAELQALRLLYDLPNADMKELDLVFKRLNANLSEANRPELIERMVQARMQTASKFDPNYDPATMGERTAGEARSIAIQERNAVWNRLDPETRALVDADNAQKASRRFAKVYGDIKNFIAEQQAAGKIGHVTPVEIDAVVTRFLEGRVAINQLDSSLQEVIRESLYDTANRWDGSRSVVIQELAAMDANVEALRQFAAGVMAKKGLIDIGDSSFHQRLSAADQFSKMSQNMNSYSAAQILSVLARAGFVGGAGLEYDPEGVYIPFLGTVTFNPEKLLDNPLVLAVAPGLPTLGGKLARLGIKRVGKPAYDRLPEGMRTKIRSATRMVIENFGPSGGYAPELIDMISQSKNASARMKKNWYELATLINSRFSPEEREQIAVLVTKDEGWEDVAKLTQDNPDIQSAVALVKASHAYIETTFKNVGLTSEHFKDFGDNYLARYYKNIVSKPLNAIFRASNISPIRANFLKRRGVKEVLRDTRVDGVSYKALSVFLQRVRDENIQLIDDMRINGYTTPGGGRVYAVAGSTFDEECKRTLTSWHVWDEAAGTRGFIIDGQSSKHISLRRDYTKAERQTMGEVVDVSVRLAAMGDRLSKDYQKAHLYNSIANSNFTLDTTQKMVKLPTGTTVTHDVAKQWALDNGYRYIPNELETETGALVYGALSGKYIKEEAWEAMMSAEPGLFKKWLNSEAGKGSTLGKALATYSAGLRAWKIAKTALSPVAHMNNFVSNGVMSYILGRNPIEDLREGIKLCEVRNMDIHYKKLYQEGKIAEAQPIIKKMQEHPYYARYQEIRDANMADSSEWAHEISADSLAEQLAVQPSAASETGGFVNTLKSLFSSAGDAARWAQLKYEGGDLIYKMGAFSVERNKGKDISTSLRSAYEVYFDYSQLAPGIKFLRDSGIVPFVSYMYKAIPALVKAIQQHPGRIAVAGLTLEGMHLAGLAGLYGDTELIQTKEAVDEALPKHLQSRGLGGLFRTRVALPFSGEERQTAKGKKIPSLNVLDMSRMIPGGDLWETNSAGLTDVEFSVMGAGKMLGSMLMQSPVISSAVMAMAEGNPVLGTSFNVGGDLDSPVVKERIRSEFLKSFWNSMVPNLPFIPYTYSQDNLMQGLVNAGVLDSWKGKNNMDFSGLPQSFTTAMLSQVGIKVKPIAPESMIQRKASYDEFQLNIEQGRLRKLFRDRGLTNEYRQEAREDFLQTARQVREKSNERGQFLRRLRDARQRAQGGKSLVH